MTRRKQIPIALTIAGSDSGGGAGLQADLKTFAALGVHGTSVITCLTAQNPRQVSALQATSPDMVRQQLTAVFAELRPQVIKTGMLYSAQIIDTVAGFLAGTRRRPPLVVDPVMVATSGARLLAPAAMESLKNRLLPMATLITPNVPEAQALTGIKIREPEDLRAAGRILHATLGCNVLIKGGHLADTREAIDIFFDGRTELLLRAPFVRGVSTHGTGCVYSAAIAGYLALGCPLPGAVCQAKDFITRAIANSQRAGRHSVLNTLGPSH